jgi:hypothetical protein|tara:strand:- start:6349 stop:7128 length:780 start_codon:yes stop_codon:yes gene_type:complete
MTFKLSDFKSQMDRFGGPQRSSLFEVSIVNFPVNTSKVTTRDLTFFCKNVAIPGITMAMHSYEAVGQQRKMYPTMLNPEPVQAIFMLDSSHQILSFFHSWAQRVVNYSTVGGKFSEVDGSLPFEIGYKTDYACRISIKAYSTDYLTTGNYYETILDGAFPGMMGDVDLAWEANDSYSTLPVSFQYDRIQFSGERRGSPSSRYSRGNGIVGLIEAVGDFGQLIGQDLVPRSITDSVNKFTRVTNNFDNISNRINEIKSIL